MLLNECGLRRQSKAVHEHLHHHADLWSQPQVK